LPYEREENTYPQLIDGDRLVSFNHRTATLSLTPIDGGESRAVVLPGERAIRDQLGDWDAAISCAGELPDVDPERLAIWSFSASGGHVLLVAARHPAVAAAIAQTPNASGRAAARNASRHQRLPALMRLSGRASWMRPGVSLAWHLAWCPWPANRATSQSSLLLTLSTAIGH
jgi:dienelactone hydrolase